MRDRWPEDTQFSEVVLSVEQEECSVCQRPCTSATTASTASSRCKAPCSSSASSPTAPTPAVLLTATPSVPWPRPAHLARLGHRLGRLLLDRASPLRPPLVDPPDPGRTARRLRHPPLRRRHRRLHPPLPGDARGTPAGRRPCWPQAYTRHRLPGPVHRRPAAREGARDPLRRPRADAASGSGSPRRCSPAPPTRSDA